ncbi:MAG: SDR family oxidoreductase [Anaerolineae bacterium]|nr:SDR family oxidoreductase [Anaerolineae bacterium]
MDLKDQYALVTGGAHRVGKGIVLALARAGANLVIHYGRSAEAALETAAEVEALGGDVMTMQADLADPAQIAAMFDAVQAQMGRLDVLVNSAASFQRQAFDEITVEDWDAVMAVNLRAPFLCTQYAARLMRARQRDRPALVVNIVDLGGIDVWPAYVQHGVSKAGLIHLTRIAARALAPDIRVNAVAPGPILPTPGLHDGAEGRAAWERTTQRIPLKRAGAPEEIGQAVVALAGNDYITGMTLHVDGGEHLL